MSVKGRVRAVAMILLLLFLGPVVNLTRFQVLEADSLAQRADNSRRLEDLSLRGRILDRAGQPLAVTKGRQRLYPLGEITGPLLGYLTSRLGSAGLEAMLEKRVLGRPIPRTPDEALRQLDQGSRKGDDVVLTLDRDLQKRAYALLAGHRGAAVVLDVDTGEILAAASRPSFDPALLEEEWDVLRVDKDAPLVERVTQGLYPPGSTFKILTMSGGLADGQTRMSETFVCTGSMDAGHFILNDNAVHGAVSLEEAFVWSCNVAFGTIGQRLGKEGIRAWMEAFRLLEPMPLVPGAEPARAPQSDNPSVGAEAGIGQADLLVSPLGMARMAATIARGGYDVAPRLLKAQTRGGKAVWRPEPGDPVRVLPPEVARALQSAMLGVVTRGTGRGAAVPGVQVAGKTGTAENPHGASHAWFVGYAPAGDPRVAVAVILENTGGGGTFAAPLASRLLEAALAK